MGYLILGFLLATIGNTIVESLCVIISCVTELVKSKISVKIVECNQKITEASDDKPIRQIDFVIPETEGDEEEYDDCEEY